MKEGRVTVIILTLNEHLHIKRCIDSARQIAERVVVVDSFSTDDTVALARSLGADIYQNAFVNNAHQFQWALDHCAIDTEWVMKMDADEYLMPDLIKEIQEKIPAVDADINGFKIKCRVYFMGKWIRHGYYPMLLNRLFRTASGYMEQKWMDEHIQLKSGKWAIFQHDMVDENLNNLTWWTHKHNQYATREAITRLDAEYGFLPVQNDGVHHTKANKRFYLKLPLFLRGMLYFVYRYIFKGGFLDGKAGLIWHLLQGFWYQTLIDAKMVQIKYYARTHQKSIVQVIEEDFGIRLRS